MPVKKDPGLKSDAPARPGDPIELDTSVAGEEDPGASFDTPDMRSDPPKTPQPKQPSGSEAARPAGKPGPGKTPGSGGA